VTIISFATSFTNLVRAIDLSVKSDIEYDWFNIADKKDWVQVDIKKAEKLLNY